MPVWQLDERILFPDPELAIESGLIAVGGDLSKERLILAYASGIFPWYIDNNEIYWFSPEPRCVLFPHELKISKSMQQLIKRKHFTVSFDKKFERVIKNCKSIKRKGHRDSWIDKNFINAYLQLHEAGFAHSVEVYENKKLVGGLYGVSLGSCFFGESMFSKVSSASKFALIYLVQKLSEKNFSMIDCQIYNDHLASMGAKNIERKLFLQFLGNGLNAKSMIGFWTTMFDD